MGFEEKPIKTETLYEGRIVTLKVETVELPNMKYGKREIVEHARGVGVIAVTERNTMYMVRQYRVAVKKMMLEIPAGLVDPEENPADAAKRELQEEIGYSPKKLEYIMDVYASPGFTDEKLSLFVASDLEESKLPEDDTEFLEVLEFSIEELYEKLLNFEITDAKTVIAIQYAYHNLRKREQ